MTPDSFYEPSQKNSNSQFGTAHANVMREKIFDNTFVLETEQRKALLKNTCYVYSEKLVLRFSKAREFFIDLYSCLFLLPFFSNIIISVVVSNLTFSAMSFVYLKAMKECHADFPEKVE